MMMESFQIDKIVTFDIKYTYHKSMPAIGDTVPSEPATVEIHSVHIGGSAIMFNKDLWDEFAEQIMEDFE